MRSTRLLVLSVMVIGACGDDGVSKLDGKIDGGPDTIIIDGSTDGLVPDQAIADQAIVDQAIADQVVPDQAPPDQAPPDQAPPDQTVPDQVIADQVVPDQAPPDQMIPDQMMPDQGTTGGKVLYFTGSSSSALTLTQVNSDGTGKAPVASITNPMDLYWNYIYGRRREYAFVNRTRPMPLEHVTASYEPVSLPGTLGQLWHYIETGTNTGRGFFTIGTNGTVTPLAFEPGTSNTTETYYYYIGANEAGTMIAAVKAYDSTTDMKVHLIKTDGTTFAGGSTVCDVTPTTPAVYYARYYGFHFAEKNLYFTAEDVTTSSTYYLLRAPLDCTAKASEVTFPAIAGTAVSFVDYYFTKSEDGKKLAVLARAGTTTGTNEEIFVVDDATGATTNISESPGNYEDAGYYIMYYSTTGTRIDISPTGKNLAYVKYENSDYELYVRPVDKSAAAVHITSDTNFDVAVDDVASATWINDDDLIFWAGVSNTTMDMYHYKLSTGALVNLTQSGGTTKPYAGGGTLRPYGGWYSPNGQYLYYMEHATSPSTTSSIRAINRTTAAITDITTGIYVYYGTSNLEANLQGDRVFFYGETGSSGNDENLYYFDQNAGTPAVKLTSFSATNYIYDIFPSSDGTLVAFGAGASASALDLYVATVGTTPTVTKLTTTPGYISDIKVFTPDNANVVYGTGTGTGSLDLRIQPVTGAAHTVLESTTGYTSPVIAY